MTKFWRVGVDPSTPQFPDPKIARGVDPSTPQLPDPKISRGVKKRKNVPTLRVLCLVSVTLTHNSMTVFVLVHRQMVFCYQNCYDLLWEKIVLLIEKNFWSSRLKTKNLQNFEISSGTIYSNSERSEQILVTECFLTCSWRFLRLNELEQSKFKFEKIIGIEKHAGKVRKYYMIVFVTSANSHC